MESGRVVVGRWGGEKLRIWKRLWVLWLGLERPQMGMWTWKGKSSLEDDEILCKCKE